MRIDLGRQIKAAGHSESGYVAMRDTNSWVSVYEEKYVSFNNAYTRTPSVIMSVTNIDSNTVDENLRFVCKPKNVSLRGFYIFCQTWDSTRVWTFGVRWLAVADLS